MAFQFTAPCQWEMSSPHGYQKSPDRAVEASGPTTAAAPTAPIPACRNLRLLSNMNASLPSTNVERTTNRLAVWIPGTSLHDPAGIGPVSSLSELPSRGSPG